MKFNFCVIIEVNQMGGPLVAERGVRPGHGARREESITRFEIRRTLWDGRQTRQNLSHFDEFVVDFGGLIPAASLAAKA